ncbi:MAG: Crp/Fnr family transcriptional regulator [Vicinamibacterales bacterium]|nr:Crp/Fnr family transcriptional regulator [Vicinamibacterales bacterium]
MRNTLLARLPGDEYHGLLPHLEPIRLRQGQVLISPHSSTKRIYFPGGGLCSISYVTEDGRRAGVALVGREGLVGMTGFGGPPDSGMTAAVEIAGGESHVMDVKAFRSAMKHLAGFNHVIHRYAQVFAEDVMQSVVCNALHSIEQRYARRLLDIRDRSGRRDLPLTQAALADMLGVRRASITLAAGLLTRAGLIERAHTRIVVSDPAGLEAMACECYGVVRHHFARLAV